MSACECKEFQSAFKDRGGNPLAVVGDQTDSGTVRHMIAVKSFGICLSAVDKLKTECGRWSLKKPQTAVRTSEVFAWGVYGHFTPCGIRVR